MSLRRRWEPPGPRLPTEEQLQKMGFVQCAWRGCTIWIDPANLDQGFCRSHEAERDRSRRFHHRARTVHV